MAGPYGQQVDIDRLVAGELDGVAALLERKVALRLEESEDVEIKVPAGLQQLAPRAVHVKRQAVGCARGAGGHAQHSLASAVVHHERHLWLGRLRFG